jgi:hypothetical protein
VRLWDPAAATALGEPLSGHSYEVTWGAWGVAANLPVLATGGADGTVRLWDPAAATALGEPLSAHSGSVLWGAWGVIAGHPVLATGSTDGTVRLWDPVTRTALGAPLSGHGWAYWGAWELIGDLPVLATGYSDRTVRLWDPVAETELGVPLTGHSGRALCGAWGVVGDRPVLATGGTDENARLWDPVAQTALGVPLTGHSGWVTWVAWGVAAGRPVLATGSTEGTVRLWEVITDRALPRLPSYRSDLTTQVDELSRIGDAGALAELITARSASPPLAVGLFGDWGEGKSHFLGLLNAQVAAVTRPDNPLACSDVRQVQFNAWHYAETDLWASLVSELFTQLTVPPDGDLGAEQRRQSRLAAELISSRGLLQRLRAAQDRYHDLEKALRNAEQSYKPWGGLADSQQQELRDLLGRRAETFYRDVAVTTATWRETGRGYWRLLRTLHPATVGRLLALLMVVVAAAIAVALLIPNVRWSAAASAVAAVLAVVQIARRISAQTAMKARKIWQAAVRMGEAQRQRMQTAADVAAAEVAVLEREVQDLTAAGQLAGFVTDRASDGNYRSRLGLMTQIREDFERMAALLAAVGQTALATPLNTAAGVERPGDLTLTENEDEVGDKLPQIDRIILYIDDLDRCPPSRVVEMLEAIHLLLALRLFVVVVAVDPRWLLRAIAAHYRDLLPASSAPPSQASQGGTVDPDDEESWNSTPAQYLEKIFQVVLTLPPLETNGYQRLLRTLVGTRPDQISPSPSAMSSPVAVDANQDTPLSGEEHESVDVPWTSTGMYGITLPPARVVEKVDPLTLEPDELALLDLLGPPLLISTPRAAKRMANSYGLLTALRRENRASDLSEHEDAVVDSTTGSVHAVSYYPYRAGMVLLAALIAFPAQGPALFLHLYHTATQQPQQSWKQFLSRLQPRQESGHWCNPADPSMTAVQAQQWQALLDGLEHVARLSREQGLPVPDPLTAWLQWVIPVGRLSFPTGRIVNTLERQRPLPNPTSPVIG